MEILLVFRCPVIQWKQFFAAQALIEMIWSAKCDGLRCIKQTQKAQPKLYTLASDISPYHSSAATITNSF